MTSPSALPHTATQYEPILVPLVGWLVGMEGEGLPLVDFPGNPAGPCAARRTVPLEPEALRQAVAYRQGVVLVFEKGDPRLPVIIGVLQEESAHPLLDALLTKQDGTPAPEQAPAQLVEAHVDGKRVVIEGTDEVVLKCGQASITLRRNGKLILRGAYVETHSSGVNRIKGGNVQVN